MKSEKLKSPEKPIYLVGESIGACLALAVAARNPEIDLILILANPGLITNSFTISLVILLIDQVSYAVNSVIDLILQRLPSQILNCNLSQLS